MQYFFLKMVVHKHHVRKIHKGEKSRFYLNKNIEVVDLWILFALCSCLLLFFLLLHFHISQHPISLQHTCSSSVFKVQ
uniref:Putative ovule protein n=1 Tax=Solanum chacoense TaxID=4108 RepID=A0A0V0GVU9_SOLCH